MIDLKHEIERELSLIDPPDLWDRIQADASNNADAAVLDLTTAPHRRRPSLWLAVAAVAVVIALLGVLARLDDHQTVDITPATEVPVVPEPPANDDGPTTLAKGENVKIECYGDPSDPARLTDPGCAHPVGLTGLAGTTLNIDAEREHGEVTGEFRVNNVVVTLQCADTDTIDGEIRLGGEVTDDPDGQGLPTPDGVNVAVGDRVALIIRERGPDFDQVSLYANDSAGSCTELVESVPYNLDGGYFNDVEDGDAIETGGVQFNP